MATIESTNYDKVSKTLKIVFGYDTEKVYTYNNVPAKIAKGLDTAESKGKFFHANIRPKYKATWEFAE